MIVVGLDPGPEKSGLVTFDSGRIIESVIDSNEQVIVNLQSDVVIRLKEAVLVIEKVESFGMAVGAEVFETVFWSGRFAQAWSGNFERLPRRVIKQHICHTARATDANIRQALIDRFGGQEKAIGKKASPGPLYGLKGHLWAAFAVAITYYDQHTNEVGQIQPKALLEF